MNRNLDEIQTVLWWSTVGKNFEMCRPLFVCNYIWEGLYLVHALKCHDMMDQNTNKGMGELPPVAPFTNMV